MRASLRVLKKNSRYRSLFAARSASVFGSQFTSLALAFGILNLPGQRHAGTLGLVFAANATGTVVFLLVGGVLADRVRRDRVIMSSDLVSALATAGLATLFATHHAGRASLMALAFVTGSAGAVRSPALTGILPSILSEELFEAGNALLRLSQNAASLAGPAIASVVIATSGSASALYVDAASFLVSVAFVHGMKLTSSVPTGTSLVADLKYGWKAFVSHQWVWVVVLGFMFFNAAEGGAFAVLGPIVMKTHFHGAISWAVVTTSMAIGSLVGAAVVLVLRPRRTMVFAIVAISPGILFILVLVPPWPLALIALTGLLYSVGADIFGVLWESSLQRHIEPHVISRVSSYDWMGSLLATPIGLTVAGLLADRLGVRQTLVGAAVVVGLCVLGMLASPGVRAMTSRPDHATGPEAA